MTIDGGQTARYLQILPSLQVVVVRCRHPVSSSGVVVVPAVAATRRYNMQKWPVDNYSGVFFFISNRYFLRLSSFRIIEYI
jgi:hypothetical protein